MSKKERYMVTSALPYANGPIHLGHLAGAYLPADIFVRYCRLKKSDVVYICGSDEHGVPIMLRARTEGVSPQEIVDRYHEMNQKSFAAFGMSFDYYGRTSSKIHHETSQEIFRTIANKNVFQLKTEKQLYDPEAKMYIFKIKRTTSGKISVNSESKLKYGSSLVSIEPLEKLPV